MVSRSHTESVNKVSGIYAITCNPTKEQYVGSAEDALRRWAGHRGVLRAGKHDSRKLQKAWQKYGEAAFTFSVLEEVVVLELVAKEQHYLDTLAPVFNTKARGATRAVANSSKKTVTTVRLFEDIHAKLKKAAYVFSKPQSQIVEEALLDYFDKYSFNCRYQLHVTADQIILMELKGDQQSRVVEVAARNGVPPRQLVLQYQQKLKEPVDLVENQGD